MKKWMAVVGALALVAIMVVPASAFSFQAGKNLGKMGDWGSFVDPNSQTPKPVGPPSIGDWDITLAGITQLYQPDVVTPANEYYSGSSPELTVLFYDLEVVGITTLRAPGTLGAFDPGQFRIALGSSGRQTSDGSPYTGGRVDIYEDPLNDLDPAGSGQYVNDWAFSNPSGAGWWVNPFDAGEFDTFPTGSNGTPILSGTLVDPDGAGAIPLLTFDLDYLFGAGGNVGFGYIDIVYNPTGVLFETRTNSFGVNYDISFSNDFTFYPNESFEGVYEPRVDDPATRPVYWNAESQDPLRFTIIPEPATLTLLGLGIAGLGARIARRRKA